MQIFLLEHLKTQRNWIHFPCIDRFDWLSDGVMLLLLFSGAENIERVVFTIIQGAVDFPDPIAQKTCFIILSKLVELWGEKQQHPTVELFASLFLCFLRRVLWWNLQEGKTAWWASPTSPTNTSFPPVSSLRSNPPLTSQTLRRFWWVPAPESSLKTPHFDSLLTEWSISRRCRSVRSRWKWFISRG